MTTKSAQDPSQHQPPHPSSWWKTEEAQSLMDAAAKVDDAFNHWQEAKQRAEKRVIQDWELSPHSAVFASHRTFVAALAEAIADDADVQQAWFRFQQAVRLQHQTLLSWIDEMSRQIE